MIRRVWLAHSMNKRTSFEEREDSKSLMLSDLARALAGNRISADGSRSKVRSALTPLQLCSCLILGIKSHLLGSNQGSNSHCPLYLIHFAKIKSTSLILVCWGSCSARGVSTVILRRLSGWIRRVSMQNPLPLFALQSLLLVFCTLMSSRRTSG